MHAKLLQIALPAKGQSASEAHRHGVRMMQGCSLAGAGSGQPSITLPKPSVQVTARVFTPTPHATEQADQGPTWYVGSRHGSVLHGRWVEGTENPAAEQAVEGTSRPEVRFRQRTARVDQGKEDPLAHGALQGDHSATLRSN